MLTDKDREKAKAARALVKPRKEKMEAYRETFAKQRKEFPKMALPIIDQCEKGNVSSFIKLKCLDCSNWVRQEIRDCVITCCPLFPVRPFQKIKGKNPNDA